MTERMVDMIRIILTNVLTALYQPFGFAIILTVLFMFFYLYAKEHGWKTAMGNWWNALKSDSLFRRLFAFVFYVAMILFRTLLNRNIWANPLSDVIGIWGLYNAEGELTTEPIENVILFIPFTILMFWCFNERQTGIESSLLKVLWKALKVTFLCSLTVECLQLFLRLGTFQLSDLFHNTLGGVIGGLIFWIGCKVRRQGDF